MSSNCNRPIIKAHRKKNRHDNEGSTKFHSIAKKNETHTHVSLNQRKGTKRPRNEEKETHVSSAKKQCTTSASSSTSTPKNSANARLSHLKDSLKKSLNNKSKVNDKNDNIVIESASPRSNSRSNKNHIVPKTEGIPEKFNTTPAGKKNSAKARMKRLRDSLDANKSVIEITDSPMKSDRVVESLPSCSKTSSSAKNVHEAEENTQTNESFIDRTALTNSWLNNNVRTMDTSVNTEKEVSLFVNVNDSVAELHRLNNLDQSEDMEWNSSFQNIHSEPVLRTSSTPPLAEPVEKIKNLCIIVDTNVFISHLNKLEEILNMRTEGTLRPILYIPWMVNVELDFIKDQSPNKSLKGCAQNAIRFIHSELKFPDSRIIGQSVIEASRQIEVGTSPDDKIIACCLQVSEKYENILVVSNDINLRNKCLINKFATCSANEARIKIVTLLRRNINSMKIISKMSFMLSAVIKKCAQNKFGDNWNKRELLHNCPWQFIDCARIIKRYWSEVFKHKLLKQCLKTVDEVFGFLATHNFIIDDSRDFEEFMKLCITLCIFLKDIKECTETVDSTLREISSIK